MISILKQKIIKLEIIKTNGPFIPSGILKKLPVTTLLRAIGYEGDMLCGA